MTSITFFRSALALPVVFPLLLLPFDLNVASAIFLYSLWYAGIPYLLFAGVLFYWIGRIKNADTIRHLSYVTPLMFLPFQVLAWRLYSGEWSFLLFSVYVLILGYFYVVVANLLYAIVFRRDTAKHGS